VNNPALFAVRAHRHDVAWLQVPELGAGWALGHFTATLDAATWGAELA
jgi:hypothetical protein